MLFYLWKNRERPEFFSPKWFKSWAKRTLTFPDLIVRSCRLLRLRLAGARIGEGTVLSNLSIGGCPRVTIGSESFVGRVRIHAEADVQIGSNVCINDGVRLLTASHDVKDPEWKSLSAPIVIDDFAWIASEAIILPGVRIGKGAVVGAGAVVARSIPDFAIAVGNPARIRQQVRPQNLCYSPSRFVAVLNAWLGKPQPQPQIKFQ